MQVAIPLLDRFTATDLIGPYEVLSRIPGNEVRLVSHEAGPVVSDTRMLTIVADSCFEDVPAPQIIVVPGGPSVNLALDDRRVLDWIAAAHESSTYTTSVCNGSMLLGAAGVLQGKRATSNWQVVPELSAYGAEPVADERVVIDGKIITGAGVTAGYDMALRLAAMIAGEEIAKAIQLGLEYDPDPPFDSGSPSKATAQTIELVRMAQAQSEAELEATRS